MRARKVKEVNLTWYIFAVRIKQFITQNITSFSFVLLFCMRMIWEMNIWDDIGSAKLPLFYCLKLYFTFCSSWEDMVISFWLVGTALVFSFWLEGTALVFSFWLDGTALVFSFWLEGSEFLYKCFPWNFGHRFPWIFGVLESVDLFLLWSLESGVCSLSPVYILESISCLSPGVL